MMYALLALSRLSTLARSLNEYQGDDDLDDEDEDESTEVPVGVVGAGVVEGTACVDSAASCRDWVGPGTGDVNILRHPNMMSCNTPHSDRDSNKECGYGHGGE